MLPADVGGLIGSLNAIKTSGNLLDVDKDLIDKMTAEIEKCVSGAQQAVPDETPETVFGSDMIGQEYGRHTGLAHYAVDTAVAEYIEALATDIDNMRQYFADLTNLDDDITADFSSQNSRTGAVLGRGDFHLPGES